MTTFKEELEKQLKDLSRDKEQMKQLQNNNPKMYDFIKERFPLITTSQNIQEFTKTFHNQK